MQVTPDKTWNGPDDVDGNNSNGYYSRASTLVYCVEAIPYACRRGLIRTQVCVCVCVHVIMREKKRARAIRLGLCMCNTKYIYVCIITSTALIYTYMYINGELCTRLMMLLWSTNAFWRGRRMQANTNYRFRITPTCAARIHDYTLFKINTHTHTLTNTRRIRLVKLLCTHVTCSFRETPTPRRV